MTEIQWNDIQIQSYRSAAPVSEAKLQSAVMLVHLPTGIVSSCATEKRQYENIQKAFVELNRLVQEQHNKPTPLDIYLLKTEENIRTVLQKFISHKNTTETRTAITKEVLEVLENFDNVCSSSIYSIDVQCDLRNNGIEVINFGEDGEIYVYVTFYCKNENHIRQVYRLTRDGTMWSQEPKDNV